jgi:peptidylprolyl isomerase
MKKFFLVVSVVLTFLLIGCTDKNEVITLESGIQFFDDSLGTGREAKADDLITIHFAGWSINDTSKLFGDWLSDPQRSLFLIGNSKMRNQPVKFILGTNSFIKGSDEGIIGMKAGGQRTIIIPSELAYGEKGIGPVPPNTDLKLVIELLEVRDKIVAEMWKVDSALFKTTPSGLKYVIVKEGEGSFADSGKVVTVHYSGYLENGKKFDSSVERDEPFSFILGVGQVISGWDEGLKLMKKGSKAKLIIPPSLGYGELDLDRIPPNSTLIFDVELLDVH